MPTTQKLQQKHTKATQKVGGSAKKPVTKVVGGGSAKKPAATKVVGGGKAAPSKGKTTRGGSAKGGSLKIYQETKERSEDNRKLIIHLYELIEDLVSKLTSDLNTNFEFKVIFNNTTESKPIDRLTPLIKKLNLNDKEYIRSINKISVLKKYPVYVKNNSDEYLKSNYKVTPADFVEAHRVGANIDRLYTDPQYRKAILHDDEYIV